MTMQVSAARACSPAQTNSAPCLICDRSDESLCVQHGCGPSATSLALPVCRQSSQGMNLLSPPLPTFTESLLRHPQMAAIQSAQPNRSPFDHIMQSESHHPHSTPQRQPHLFCQPGPSHGAATPRQQQTLLTQRHELLPTHSSASAGAAQLQQQQFAHARTAEQQQTGLWGGQQPASGQDLDGQAPAHGKARPLQPLGILEELAQVLLEVR